MKKSIIALSIFMLVLPACSDKDIGSTTNSAANNDSNTTFDSAISYNANGTWVRECRVFNKLYWEITTLDISGNSGTKYIDVFPSDQCLTPEMEYISIFNIASPNVFTVTTEGKALQIDISFTSVKQKLLTKNIVALYNTNNICGFNDWAIRQGKEVLNLSCFLLAQPEYDIFMVKQTNQLFIGDSNTGNDGSTPDLRPTTLAPDFFSKL